MEQRVKKWADLEPSENHDSDHTPQVEAQSRAHSEAQKGLEKLIESGADQASIDLARNILSLCTNDNLASMTKAQAESLLSLCTNDSHEAPKEQHAQKEQQKGSIAAKNIATKTHDNAAPCFIKNSKYDLDHTGTKR